MPQDLSGRDFSGQDLRYANLTGATLFEANLSDANLTGEGTGRLARSCACQSCLVHDACQCGGFGILRA